MSEDFESESEDSGINKLGWYLVAGMVVLLVVATVYGIMHTGVDLHVSGNEGVLSGTDDSIDVNKLRDEARATPAPTSDTRIERTAVQLVESQPAAAASPDATQKAPHQKSAEEVWREQEALKAREASPIVAAFEPKPNQTKEIPSLNQSKLQPPPSPWTIDEGSVISTVLLFGVNSDYPGDIVSQIERPLYDSATGRYLLVPAGSKLIGKFQRPVGPFQERIEIAWNRLILPNNWSMALPQMPATDTAGYAGVGGDVNHHYASTFGAAALVSLLSIAGQVASVMTFSNAVSPYNGGAYAYSPTQQVGNLVGTNTAGQLGATGSQFLAPRLNRPNTVTINPGTRFDVFVNADLILPGPYHDAAGQLIDAQETK
jgi:type IV secretory pathway VirB10-like protein